jgi:prolyl-tRNA synthetase
MDGLAARITALLDEIQQALFDRAVKFRDEHTSRTDSYDEFKQIMEGRPGFVISPWCGEAQCEATSRPKRRRRSATSRRATTGAGQAVHQVQRAGTVSAWFAKSY